MKTLKSWVAVVCLVMASSVPVLADGNMEPPGYVSPTVVVIENILLANLP